MMRTTRRKEGSNAQEDIHRACTDKKRAPDNQKAAGAKAESCCRNSERVWRGTKEKMLTTIIGIAIGTFVGRLIFDIWKSRRKGDGNVAPLHNKIYGEGDPIR